MRDVGSARNGLRIPVGPRSRNLAEQGGRHRGGAGRERVAVKLPETALFEFGKSEVRGDARAVVDRSAVLLKRSKKPVIVEGYTDNVGTLEYNQQLSEARATAVGHELVERGVPIDHIRTKGNAYNDPVASNDTAEGRALNRRTEIIVRGETMDTLMGKK